MLQCSTNALDMRFATICQSKMGSEDMHNLHI